MRKAVGFSTRPKPVIGNVSYGAVLGQNERDLADIMNPNQAETVKGYIQDGQGRLESSNGIKLIAEKSGITGFKAGDWWYDDLFLVGYGTTIAVVDESAQSVTEVKTDLSQDVTDVVSYGNYAFVASGTYGDKLYRISKTLAYDAQTVNFTVGQIVTGGTSGATATILEDNDGGATGTLTIGDITGTFQDDEIITDPLGGSATADGVLTYAATEETNSVPSNVLFIKQSYGGGNPGVRLFCGGADGNPRKLIYTKTDTGTNPPWGTASDWDTTGTSVESAGEITGKSNINTVTSRGNSIIIGFTDRRYPFEITSTEAGGVLVQDIRAGWEYKDRGMSRGAVDTSYGTFYLSDGGLYKMVSENKDKLVSAALGRDYFSNVTLTEATIEHDARNNIILASYGKDSTTNNEVLIYHLDTEAISIRSGWNINRFIRSTDRVYGLSSSDGKMYKLFEGYTDNELGIVTELKQEIKGVRADYTSFLNQFVIQAVLFEGETLTIHFDIENPDGGFVEDATTWTIEGQTPAGQLQSWGSAGYGSAGWGSGSGGQTFTPQKYHHDMNLEFLRCKVRITGILKTPHTINYYQSKVLLGNPINLNNITQVT